MFVGCLWGGPGDLFVVDPQTGSFSHVPHESSVSRSHNHPIIIVGNGLGSEGDRHDSGASSWFPVIVLLRLRPSVRPSEGSGGVPAFCQPD